MAYEYYQDPYQGWYDDEYDMYQYGEQPLEEDTESQKLRKEQEMIEAIESNRLYLRKVRKRCVQEDFANLEKTQMFLFEFLIESLEVNTKSDLGLVPESSDPSELVVKIQFLDTPCLEIREKGEKIEASDSVLGQNEYFQTVGNAGLNDAVDPGKTVEEKDVPRKDSLEKDESEAGAPADYDTKWENSSGKSLLFSKSALEIIQGLDHSPVKVQVSKCVELDGDEGKSACEPLGYAKVHLSDHFSLSVLQSCKSGVILPVSCVHRDSCELKNVFGVKKGELQVFVRLSCFGTAITTSFQSVGRERQYVFKPSPQPDLEGKEESEIKRDLLLKPIVAEEEVAVGISVAQTEDAFRKTVVWGKYPQNCEGPDEDFLCKFNRFKDYCLRKPHPSDVSLCRDANPSHDQGKPFCDWHDLVSKEIKNSPGGNCGCLDNANLLKSPKTFRESSPINQLATKELPFKTPLDSNKMSKRSSAYPQTQTLKPSRLEKLMGPSRQTTQKVPELAVEPITGVGIPCEPKDCNCDCARIKNTLAMHPMMKYSWQVK